MGMQFDALMDTLPLRDEAVGGRIPGPKYEPSQQVTDFCVQRELLGQWLLRWQEHALR